MRSEYSLWPTKVWLVDLDIGHEDRVAIAEAAEQAIRDNQAGPHPWSRVDYDLWGRPGVCADALKPALCRLALSFAREALGYEYDFAVETKAWANFYAVGTYVPPHYHAGDLTASYFARVPDHSPAATAVSDPRVLPGYGRGRTDWATKFFPMREGWAIIHPSGIPHHHAPVLVPRGITVVSADFWLTPKDKVVPMSGDCDLAALTARSSACQSTP